MKTPFRILLALDSSQIHKHLLEDLKKSFLVETAKDAEEVYHKVHHFCPDLAIVDYALKNINPIELYEGIEFLHPETMYVLCVNDDNLKVATRVWRKRAIDYIRKPIHKKHLVDDIFKIVRHIIDIRKIRELESKIQLLEQDIARLKIRGK